MKLRRITPLALLASVLTVGACGGATSGASTEPSAGGAAAVPAVIPASDWPMYGYIPQRTNVGPLATGITARDLSTLKDRRIDIDGTVDSSAIELHAVKVGRVRDVAVVTTTYGRTIAFDPGTGQKLWEFVPPGIHSYEGSSQITTATPVFDPNRRYVYATSPDGFVRKLVLASGREVRSRHWPARMTLDPTREKLPAALNISGGSLIVTTGGYIGDAPSYQGHVVVLDRASGRIVHVWNSLCSNRHFLIVPRSCPESDSAIWARAGAVVEPGSGRLLVATGNAAFNGKTYWGDSVLELAPDAGRLLQNWTPRTQASLNGSDTDLGSTAPALLPPYAGLHLAVQSGKDGNLYLLNLARLNGTGGASPRTGGELQSLPAPGSGEVLTTPLVWTHNGRTNVFVANDSGTAEYVLEGGSHPRLRVVAQRAAGGTSPVLAGGLLYVYDESNGLLRIYNPVALTELAQLAVGRGHWNSPIVAGGRIIVPTGNSNDHATSGTIDIYHLPGR